MTCFQTGTTSTAGGGTNAADAQSQGQLTSYGESETAAAGGFLIYPNKPNNNMMQGVYLK
jgi:hypothetical protein